MHAHQDQRFQSLPDSLVEFEFTTIAAKDRLEEGLKAGLQRHSAETYPTIPGHLSVGK
jgi:hypothetical protein